MPKKYIEQETAICRLREAIPYHDNSATGLERAISYLQSIPTVDAVPVVRCWECEHGKYDDEIEDEYCYHCRYDGFSYNKADHFCSYGERKGGNE